MTNIDWQSLKSILQNSDHDTVFKSLVSYFYDINDNEILDQIYLDYMDNDAILTFINNDLNQLVQRYIDKMS
ncbi:hypothetical protein BUX98_10440 [Staphylococcus chromogenes]|uniref:hypothetical protein n=1 Tax=Staphylococcus chromogenes TaxID=46126 RepID=UPI000D03D53A|nr:hypothetical protein [Staphylococcus chromogenes]MCD9071842.1 hypothetical protein [Staphylococcus chromogenes]MEB7432833.1 hypothetical protein [Staphylococcus chromogenes]RIL88562.1 hypothetical protein BUX98_10440 [Staphylococcus chromogenes]RIL94792.1 hypothetical protein BUY05_06640 [Staphylococcus chromogenes]RIM18542.1 hypothetical protein BU664_10905 [Staphylococcus chromogenes]